MGHYDFQPGQEMQHDTSPHRATIAGVEQRIETASLVLCYSRMLFFQASPAFTRFSCKVFLTDALAYLGGAAATCMIDNTHVVVATGTGARMVPAPEMAAFAERFAFTFRAHEKGDANRSARVERPFHFIEHNFLAGRTFADLPDLNAQARVFCDKVNATQKRHLHASPRELFAAERPHLHPLPLFVPEVYALHHRLVDVEGFVNVHGHRYSVPYLLIGRQLEVRETKDRIDVYHGPRLVASHATVLGRTFTRVTVPEHRPPRGARPSTQPGPEEQTLAQADPPVPAYAVTLKAAKRGPRHAGAAPAARAVPRVSARAVSAGRHARGPVRPLRSRSPGTSHPPGDREGLLPPGAGRRGARVMTDEIEQLLRNLHLRTIAAIVDDELAHAEKHELSYGAFLARLLRAQYHHRQETALAWRIKQARLPEAWTIESFPFKRQPGVNPKQIRALADLEFVAKAENLVFIGQTGVGKTGLASGLLLKAIQNGYRARFIRAQDLFDEMYASLADRSTRRLLNTLIRIDVLHIDELGYLNLKPEQTNIFFKLMEERYRRKPTIITTNLDYPEWQTFLGNKALVEALLSRLRHQCHTIRIDGPSLRDPQG